MSEDPKDLKDEMEEVRAAPRKYRRVRIVTDHKGLAPGLRPRGMDTQVQRVTYDEKGNELSVEPIGECVYLNVDARGEFVEAIVGMHGVELQVEGIERTVLDVLEERRALRRQLERHQAFVRELQREVDNPRDLVSVVRKGLADLKVVPA